MTKSSSSEAVEFVVNLAGETPEELLTSLRALDAQIKSRGLALKKVDLGADRLTAAVTIVEASEPESTPPARQSVAATPRASGSEMHLTAHSEQELRQKLVQFKRRCRSTGVEVVSCTRDAVGIGLTVSVTVSWKSCLGFIAAVLRKLAENAMHAEKLGLVGELSVVLKALAETLRVVRPYLQLDEIHWMGAFPPDDGATLRLASQQLAVELQDMRQLIAEAPGVGEGQLARSLMVVSRLSASTLLLFSADCPQKLLSLSKWC